MAIILDTNVLPRSGVLRYVIVSAVLKVAEHRGLQVCVPSLVVEESVNARREAVIAVSSRLQTAIRDASKLFEVDGLYLPDSEEVASSWRAELHDAFNVIEVRPEDALEGLRREAHRIPPAHGGRGSRDSAIWLATIRHHNNNGGPTHFVSENTKDFASGGALHPRLEEDLAGNLEGFHYHANLGDLLGSLSSEVVCQPSVDSINYVRNKVFLRVHRTHNLAVGDPALLLPSDSDLTNLTADVLIVEPTSHKVLKAYSIEGDLLALLELRWEIGYGADEDEGEIRMVPLIVRMWAELDSTSGPITDFTVESVRLGGVPATRRP